MIGLAFVLGLIGGAGIVVGVLYLINEYMERWD